MISRTHWLLILRLTFPYMYGSEARCNWPIYMSSLENQPKEIFESDYQLTLIFENLLAEAHEIY